jgi:GntR family transcriptional regulator
MSILSANTPVYRQLNALLRDLIRAGEFQPGERFLTERQIVERFGVSRATANKALSNLVAEGIVEFRKGVGTFVCVSRLQYDTTALVSFTDKALAARTVPMTQVLQFAKPASGDAPDIVAAALQVSTAAELIFVERLRLASALPVVLERRYVVASRCPELCQADVEGSLYSAWTTKYGRAINGAEETIRAVNLRGDEAKLLRTRQGAAGFLVVSRGFLTGGEPLWWEQTWYRGDIYEFRNRLGPIAAERSPT